MGSLLGSGLESRKEVGPRGLGAGRVWVPNPIQQSLPRADLLAACSNLIILGEILVSLELVATRSHPLPLQIHPSQESHQTLELEASLHR